MRRLIVITGTDTGAGKTVLTALLSCHMRSAGCNVAALKPICSGGRDDARLLHAVVPRTLSLGEINPWQFRAPLSPLVAARLEKKQVTLSAVVAHVHLISHRFDYVLVEGAGGLLSPLGEGFSTRELIAALGAEVLIAARNQLGVINHVRLTLEALPPLVASRTRIVLMAPPRSTAASRTNPGLLKEYVGQSRVFELPWLRSASYDQIARRPNIRYVLDALTH